MKTFLILFAACGVAFGGNLSTIQGNMDAVVSRLTFRGAPTCTLTNALPDTVSDSISMQTGSQKPGTVITIPFDVRSNDATSTFKILVETKHCDQPAGSTWLGCDSIWTPSGNHRIYGSQNIDDTLSITGLTTAFQAYTATVMVPGQNVVRLRLKGTIPSAKSIFFNGKSLRGE